MIRIQRAALFMLATALSTDPALAGDSVDEILERVERRGADVRDLQCRVKYVTEDLVSDDQVEREGTIVYKRQSPNPIFAITFDKTVQGGVIDRQKAWYWFDGRWFFEAKESSRSVIQRDVAPPGTEIDLFSIEKAPFPIPFGQKKAEILRNFDVALVAPAPGDPDETDHLVCVPKPDSKLATDYSKLEFFVSRPLHLPVKIVMTANPADRVTSAEFPDLSDGSLNAGLSDGLFDRPAATRGFALSKE